MEKEDSRTNLEQYYKFIVVCHTCGKKYGIDKKRKHSSHNCPTCEKKIENFEMRVKE